MVQSIFVQRAAHFIPTMRSEIRRFLLCLKSQVRWVLMRMIENMKIIAGWNVANNTLVTHLSNNVVTLVLKETMWAKMKISLFGIFLMGKMDS